MSEQNVEIVRRLYEHFARGELGVAPDLYDPEIELSMIGSGGVAGDGRWRGLGEVLAANVEYLKRIWRVPHGSGKGSGAPIEHELGDMITLRKGKIVRVDFYWDRADALEAAGLSE